MGQAPDESTFRRVFARLDADALAAVIGAWLWTRTTVLGGRRVIAIDGKPSAVPSPQPGRAAPGRRVGPRQLHRPRAAGGRGQEQRIPAVRTFLAGSELAGVVVTIDAMHTQHDTAGAILGAGGDYVFTVKNNQPILYAACKNLPWADVPIHSVRSRGHGRRARCTI